METRAQAANRARKEQELQRLEADSEAQVTPLAESERAFSDTDSELDSEADYPSDREPDKQSADSGRQADQDSATDREEESDTDVTIGDLPPLHSDLFLQVPDREQKTKRQKRDSASKFSSTADLTHPLDGGADKLAAAQSRDDALRVARQSADQKRNGFYWERGLLYRQRQESDTREESAQLVLPSSYRTTVLKMAHSIPISGHLGRKKTTDRIFQRFYWPGIYQDVREMCKRCPTCQLTARHKHHKAPLIPLPVVEEPFHRIAMDMVGPLPRSKAGYRYILTTCDYGTRYPEAITL